MTAQPGLQSLYRTGSGGATTAFTSRAGLTLFALARLVARFAVRFTGRLRRVVRVARIASALTQRFLIRRRVSPQ